MYIFKYIRVYTCTKENEVAFYANYRQNEYEDIFNGYDENSQIYAAFYNREIVFDPTPAQEIYSSFLHDTY